MDIKQGLEIKIDGIFEMTYEIDIIEENTKLEKVNQIKEITDVPVDRTGNLDNRVFIMRCDRRTRNSELAKNELYVLTRDSKTYKPYNHLNYPLTKRKKCNIKKEEKRE